MLPEQEKTSNYERVKEFFVDSYEEATKLADELYAPYGERSENGSRTTELGKVRVRALKSRPGFKVILFRKKGIKEEKGKVNDANKDEISYDKGIKEVSRDRRKSGRPRRAKGKDKGSPKRV